MEKINKNEASEMQKKGLIYCRNCQRPKVDYYKGVCRECFLVLNPRSPEAKKLFS